MSFFSPQFFGFVLIILVLYYLINPKYQKVLLFLSSSVFIGTFSIVFLALIRNPSMGNKYQNEVIGFDSILQTSV